jgi:hypothetical protein
MWELPNTGWTSTPVLYHTLSCMYFILYVEQKWSISIKCANFSKHQFNNMIPQDTAVATKVLVHSSNAKSSYQMHRSRRACWIPISGGWDWNTAMYSSHSKPNSMPGIGPKGTDAQHHQTVQQGDSLHNRASNIEVEAKKVIGMIKSNKITRAASDTTWAFMKLSNYSMYLLPPPV